MKSGDRGASRVLAYDFFSLRGHVALKDSLVVITIIFRNVAF